MRKRKKDLYIKCKELQQLNDILMIELDRMCNILYGVDFYQYCDDCNKKASDDDCNKKVFEFDDGEGNTYFSDLETLFSSCCSGIFCEA